MCSREMIYVFTVDLYVFTPTSRVMMYVFTGDDVMCSRVMMCVYR